MRQSGNTGNKTKILINDSSKSQTTQTTQKLVKIRVSHIVNPKHTSIHME